jgi:putative glutamine amidotransferase
MPFRGGENMKIPIIGITCSMEYDDSQRKVPTVYSFDYLKKNYYQAIIKAGGAPILLPNLEKLKLLDQIFPLVDGLLMSGGEDLDPIFYGEKVEFPSVNIRKERDNFELELVKKAHFKKIPILGICRGLQLINVLFGGSLYQDLKQNKNFSDHTLKGSVGYGGKHLINIMPQSKLFSILKKDKIQVNTSHHQMVKNLAEGFVVSAISETDGVIEGIEYKEADYLIAVQWHPEIMIDEKNSQLLFLSLVSAAKEYNQKQKELL